MAFNAQAQTPSELPGELRIAVVSDLHAHNTTKSGASPSHLCITDPEDRPQSHPVTGLVEMIESEGLSADLLLCPGDLGDKASIEGIKYAWQAVHRIGDKLKCKLVAGTAGNHDLDSRGIKTPPDPKEVLQALAPPFPLPGKTKNDQYWSRQYAIITTDVFRLVVVNSSGFHGTQIKEIEHGRISDSTLNWLQEELATGSPRPINLLLCHHHPQSLSELKLGEKDVMRNGQLLLDLLGSGAHGRWLVVHGHKHYPKLTYAAGGANSPVVFAAGSFCAQLLGEHGTRARNQFYIIQIPYGTFEVSGFVGSYRAWDWQFGHGWRAAGPDSGLPRNGAFGCRSDIGLLASRVARHVSGTPVSWNKIREKVPEIGYLLPQDSRLLEATIKDVHGLSILRDENGDNQHIEKQA